MVPRFIRHEVPMRAPALLILSSSFAVLLAGSAHAEPWIFKYDEFPEALGQAANIVNGGQFYTQPGFVRGEAFGQIYRPLPEQFPLQVTGFDLILAAPPNAMSPMFANATIEIYNSESKTPNPGTSPVFSVTTGDLFNSQTQEFGMPLQGGVAYSVSFDMAEADSRPPLITGGNIWLMIRFDDPAMSLPAEWGNLACLQIEGLACGCQGVGTLHDSAIVPKSNVLNHVSPIGQCSGSVSGWTYMEEVPALTSGFTIDGDVILRLRADVAASPCVPECDGAVCGEDGCGGTCGTCGADRFCVDGACVSCQPNCLSKQCGDDGCGGSCGTCPLGEVCGDDYFCRDDCTPSCAGRVCGDDGCGGTCGSCGAGQSCSAGQCIGSCQPACDGKTCGPDGCGGSCGGCGTGLECLGGQCAAPCAPACAGKECGEDGCGGACGSCGAGETCQAGLCSEGLAEVAITNISPTGLAMRETAVSITGRGFQAGAEVKVGAVECTGEVVTGDALIAATVPALPVGRYTVIVINPDQTVATLVDGFTVNPFDAVNPEAGSSDGGCAGGGGAPFGLVAAALGLWLAGRRRGTL